ncbi:uncharacterized protein [Watersipora subatra]|uniref:uncharacterized protein n=1 Tax=Watersipora subatra TaxID=2589382 RepID=UPI00355C3F62
MNKGKKSAKVAARRWIKESYAFGNASSHRDVLVSSAYDHYKGHCSGLSKRQFGIVLHKVFPFIGTMKGPTVDGKRVQVYSGLIRKGNDPVTTFPHHILLDHSYSAVKFAVQDTRVINVREVQSATNNLETSDIKDSDCDLTSTVSDSDCDLTFTDEDYIPFDSSTNNRPSTQTIDIDKIIGCFPPDLKNHPNFAQLLQDVIDHCSKSSKTARRWKIK